jgi:hypothetical protein
MDFLYNQLIANKQKAIAGFISAAIVAFLAKHGLVLPANGVDVLQALGFGLVGLVSVYLKRNKA